MPELSIGAALEESLKDVLERMFFIEATGGAGSGEPTVHARLTFEGAPPGSLDVAIAQSAARGIAGDFLGMGREEVTDQQVGEVVCELANIICGGVLSRVESTATFRLGMPVLTPGDLPRAEANATICCLETGCGMLTAVLTTEGPAWPTIAKSGS